MALTAARTHPLGKIKRSSSLTVNNGPNNQIEHERWYRMPTSKWTEIERMQQSGGAMIQSEACRADHPGDIHGQRSQAARAQDWGALRAYAYAPCALFSAPSGLTLLN
jgi:hypothetical protein